MMRWILILPLFLISVVVQAVEFRVVTLDLKKVDLKLYWMKSDGSAFETLNAVRTAVGPQFVMATNSGIYAKDLTPLGLHIERGKILKKLNRSRSSKGNFFLQPNGVFFLGSNGPKILDTNEFAKHGTAGVLEATQSGPLLLLKGEINPGFKQNSTNAKLRSGVGVTASGQVVFAISKEPVTFYDFALFFKDKMNCTDALYLDGTISTLWTEEDSSDAQITGFVGIWAATKR